MVFCLCFSFIFFGVEFFHFINVPIVIIPRLLKKKFNFTQPCPKKARRRISVFLSLHLSWEITQSMCSLRIN